MRQAQRESETTQKYNTYLINTKAIPKREYAHTVRVVCHLRSVGASAGAVYRSQDSVLGFGDVREAEVGNM